MRDRVERTVAAPVGDAVDDAVHGTECFASTRSTWLVRLVTYGETVGRNRDRGAAVTA